MSPLSSADGYAVPQDTTHDSPETSKDVWSAETCRRFLFHFARNSDDTAALLVQPGALEKESDDESSHSKLAIPVKHLAQGDCVDTGSQGE